MIDTYFSPHNHSDYSNPSLGFSDSICKVSGLIQRAYDIGLQGVTITDHESLSSFVEALNYYESMEQTRPFTLALGNEIYLLTEEEYEENRYNNGTIPYFHFILIAKDDEGYRQLCKLSTRAWERAYMKGCWRRPTLMEDLVEIIQPNQGHVFGLSACLGSRIDKMLLDKNKALFKKTGHLAQIQQIFGKGNFYLEVQPSEIKGNEQSIVNTMLMKIAKQLELPIVVSTDSHYLKKDDAIIHEVFLKSQDGEREVSDFYATAYMMEPSDLREHLRHEFNDEEIDFLMSNTIELGQRIGKYSFKHKPIIPEIPEEKIPDFKTQHTFKQYYSEYEYFGYYAKESLDIHERYFFYQIEQGLKQKVVLKHKDVKTYIDRLNTEWRELKLISDELNGFMVAYYSTMSKIVDLMWEANSIVGPGRGSSSAFLTCYLLDITAIDPVPLGDYMPYWRHLSAERKAELPDIDTDSEPSKKYAIIEEVKKFFGEDKVLNVATFSSISSKIAIEKACRGLGIDDTTAAYLKSLIPVNRGKIAKLKDCLYGSDKTPVVHALVEEIKKYPNLEKCALGLCDIISQKGLHAAGLTVSNKPYTEYCSMMRAPNGTPCTCYNLWDAEEVSLVKFDLLTVDALQKVHGALDAMVNDGTIEWQGNLRDTYNKYIHPDVIDYDTPEMWDCINKMYSIFQWATPLSVAALKQIQPTTLSELSAGNSLIRLMPDGDGETPLDTYVRYKNHPEQWSVEASAYGLNEEEKSIIAKYTKDAHYLADCQEKLMRLSMDEHIAGYTLKESNQLRKSVAKKDEALQEKAKQQFYEYGKKQGTRQVMLDYVWNVLFSKSFGYSFSSIHSWAYSMIALQELNIFYHYGAIYWNIGCLLTETSDEGSGSGADYGKIAKAIYKMLAFGVNIVSPNVNESKDNFTPNAKENTIYYGLATISGINSQIANQIISMRPYDSFLDFYRKNTFPGSLVTKSKIIQLIKAGCFDCFNTNRIKVMQEYFCLSTPQKTKLTTSNLPEMIKIGVEIPEELIKPYNFKKYVCQKQFFYSIHPLSKSKKLYKVDTTVMSYCEEYFISVMKEGADYWFVDSDVVICDKSIDKCFKPVFNMLKSWLQRPETIKEYNKKAIITAYNTLDCVDVDRWAMQSTSYYHNNGHELKNLDFKRYGISRFSDLPEEPVFVEKNFGQRSWRQYEISAIAGTLIAKDDTKHIITLLTTNYDVVNCKLTREAYAHYKRVISSGSGKEKVVYDDAWIQRGSLLIVCGYRNGDDFRCKKYKNSVYDHQMILIKHVYEDGSADLQTERVLME